MKRRHRACIAGLMIPGISACKEDVGSPVQVLTRAEVLVPDTSEQLSVPVDLALDGAGRLYVLDQGYSRILRVATDGVRKLIGQAGKGPGEFTAPAALDVRFDTIRVDDRGNGRVVVLDSAGKSVRTYPIPPRLPGQMAFGANGEAAVATLGFTPAGLVQRLDSHGTPVQTYGALVATPRRFWDFSEMKAEVRRGRVPSALRNQAIPVVARGEGTWLVLVAEGEVRRFDATGGQRWARRVLSPELDRIRERFFTTNRAEKSPSAFHPLQYFADAVGVGDELWLLIAMPESEPATIVVLDSSGVTARHYRVPALPGARALAVDEARRAIYLTSPASAVIVRAELPAPAQRK